jgi:signal transduction histidine kinase
MTGLAKRLAARRTIRRCWPQKVRTRLTVLYGALFLAGGSLLLGLTYGLVAASMSTRVETAGKPPMTMTQYIRTCKGSDSASARKVPVKPGTRKPSPRQSQEVKHKINLQCGQERAYLAGSAAAAARQRQRALHELLLFSALGLGVLTVMSAGAGWIVAGRVLRPVRVITGRARRASQENLGERIALPGARDELKELADTFDEMLERLDRAFSAQRRFVADASHELRTPLTVMRTAIDVTLAKPARSQAQLEAMAVRVRRAIGRAEAMVDALLTLALSDQRRQGGDEPFNLATAAEDAMDAASAEIERLGLRVRSDLGSAEMAGDPPLLDRMVSNLVDNAVRHNVPGGEVSLVSGVRDGAAFLRVTNSGPVVPPDLVPTLFEPFRRLEARTGPRAGTGLGLAIVRSVAAVHGTTVKARSRPDGGLDVEVTLAVRAPDPPPAKPTPLDPSVHPAPPQQPPCLPEAPSRVPDTDRSSSLPADSGRTGLASDRWLWRGDLWA